MKKSRVLQELQNVFPEWSRIRNEDQSIGAQYLNTFALKLEELEKSVRTMRDNQYLSTANQSEIDILHKVALPKTFEFTKNQTNLNYDQYTNPVVSGLQNSTWHVVSGVETNSIEDFWYNSKPTRLTVASGIAFVSDELLDEPYASFPLDTDYNHHLTNGGHMFITTVSGSNFLTIDGGQLRRPTVILSGRTRKGTDEVENIVFPWNMTRKSTKEWKRIEEIKLTNFPTDAHIILKSSDCNNGSYIDFWNMEYSDTRRKIDLFWDVTYEDSMTKLQRIQYMQNGWEELIRGLDDLYTHQEWQLLDNGTGNYQAVDMAIQPFSNHLWVAAANKIYVYDIREDYYENLDLLQKRTSGPNTQIELETRSVVLGENIEFTPWFVRPISEIDRYRIWIQTPSAVKYGVLNGSLVSYTSDFWNQGSATISRNLEARVSITSTERGEYLIVLETDYIDGTSSIDRQLVPVLYKTPLVEFDVSSIISQNITGIEFNADQHLYLKTTNFIYKMNIHKDYMLIDFTNKELYFIEDYDQVSVRD